MGYFSRSAVPAVAMTLAASAALSACTGDDPLPPREPAAVDISVKGVDAMTLGLMVSSTSDRGEGSDYTGPSAGAELASYRLKLGGAKVELVVVDDRGSADEAETGMQELIDQGVSGIVLATSGKHVVPALTAASDAGIPVVAPYLRTTETLPAGVYVTGPSETAITDALTRAMEADEVTKPVTLTADDVPVPAVGAGAPLPLTGAGLEDLVEDIATSVEDEQVDSVVISASATNQAAAVAALQGAVPDVPVYLTPEATTPTFATTLRNGNGTPAGRFVSVGSPASDSSTLDSSDEADSAAAYFAALRLGAADETFTSALDDAPFAGVAGAADLPSHDAVVSLVRAAAKAKSTDPAEVGAALEGLKVGVKQHLAGPALDFSAPYALPQKAVVPLYATTQDPGVRPADSTPVLTWFGLPEDSL